MKISVVITIVFLLSMLSCNYLLNTSNNNELKNKISKQVAIKIPESYLTKSLTECFLNKVKYYKNNPDSIDPANFFSPYQYLEHTIDSISIPYIFYNKDSSIIFYYTIIRKTRDTTHYYDGMALLGYKKDKMNYEIYPINDYEAIAFYKYDEAYSVLVDCYQYKLTTKYDCDGRKFNTNVGDKNFFTNNLYFTKRKDGKYYFETYRYVANVLVEPKDYQYLEYPYPRCH